MQSKRGVTLVEMLVVMAAPVLAASWPANDAGPEVPALPSLETLLARAVSQTGCDLASPPVPQQTLAVFASPSSFSFEVDCDPEKNPDRLAAYVHPHVPVSAEPDTITFFFQPDSSTVRTDDFALMRRLNDERPVAELRNLMVYPGRPFLEYYYRATGDDGRTTTHVVPSAWLPLQHPTAAHGSAADTGLAARIDTLRAVEINYSISAAYGWDEERPYPVSKVIPLSNLGRRKDRLCDEEPSYLQSSWVMPAAYGMTSRTPVRSLFASEACSGI